MNRACRSCLVLLAALCTSCGGHEKDTTLSGQVFIVTGARASIALPLVDVVAIDESLAISHVRAVVERRHLQSLMIEAEIDSLGALASGTRAALIAANKNRDAWLNKLINNEISNEQYQAGDPAVVRAEREARNIATSLEQLIERAKAVQSDSVFFDRMPATVAMARSDAEGKFTLQIPRRARVVLMAMADRRVFDGTEHYYWIVRAPNLDSLTAPVLLDNDNLTSSRSPSSLLMIAAK